MDVFMLYLLMQADSICKTMEFVTFICCVGFIVTLIAATCFKCASIPNSESEYGRRHEETAGKIHEVLKPISKKFGIASFVLIAMNALMPTTKSLAIAVGGHYAIEAAKSETAQKIKVLVDATLDKALEKVTK